MHERRKFITAAIIALAVMAIAVTNASAEDIYIDNCTTLDVEGATYYLTADIVNNSTVGTCMRIRAENITLDGQGHIIDGIDFPAECPGVNSNQNNTTVRNCVITDWFAGIWYVGSNHGLIRNNTLHSNAYGIITSGSSNNTVESNIMSLSYWYGIILHKDSLNNTIYNNLFNNTDNFDCWSDTIYENCWNITRQPGTRIYSDGTEIGGNYWTNPTGTGYSDTCTDADHDGFCDEPHALAENNVDYLPLSDECGVEQVECWNDTFDDETKIADKQNVVVSSGDVEMDLENPVWIWESNSSLVAGLGLANYPKPAIAFNLSGDERWNIIVGENYYYRYGFYWNGSQWIMNSSLVSGLVKHKSYFSPAIAFNITGDGRLNLISGEHDGSGYFYGYYWNGSQWISDSSLAAGLEGVGGLPRPTIAFNITGDGNWNLICGDNNKRFHGFYWNDSAERWIRNDSLVSGLEIDSQYGWISPSIAFNITGDGNWNLIAGETFGFHGFYWNGTRWIIDPSIVFGLTNQFSPQPAIAFNITEDGKWNLIIGEGGGDYRRFDGYQRVIKGGSITSDVIQPSRLKNWAVFNADDTVPPGTSITYKILDASNNTIMSVVDGQDISGITQLSIRLYVELTTNDLSKTPVLHDWSVCWEPYPPNPDLTPTAITAPELFVNQSSIINATIANIGLLNASAFNVSLIANEVVVDTVSVASLKAGESANIGFEWTPTSPSENELCVVADLDNTIDEIDETNNEICVFVTVNGPDLTPTAITTPPLFVNMSSPITATIANIGGLDAASFNVSLNADGSVVDTVSIASLSAESSTNVIFSWMPTSAGNHDLCVVTDPDDAIDEMDETNNGTCIVVTVSEVSAEIVWHHAAFTPQDVERLADNNTLITEFGNHAVIEVTPSGVIVWQYGNGSAGSGEGQLSSPVDAERLSSGTTLITDSENHRVIEVNSTGWIVWQYGDGTPGAGADQLNHPMDAEKLLNGNILITDEYNNRVIEVAMNKTIVWQMTQGLDHPADAERLTSGNTLITDYSNHRVIEVNSTGGIVWQYGTTGVSGLWINELNCPTDAERLTSGNTLIADYSNHRVIEANPDKNIVGQYGTGTAGTGDGELNCPADAERLTSGNTLIADTGNYRVIEVIALTPPAPKIVSFAPPSSAYDGEGAARSFNVTTDQIVDVSWLINNFPVQTDAGVTEATYTNTSASIGTWNVSAVVSNANGTAMQTWDWEVMSFLGPDLIVTAIDAYHNNTGYSPYFNLSNEVDVEVENTGIADAGVFNVSLYADDEFIGKQPVADLGPGNATTVQFIWTPIGNDCEDDGSQQTYTLKAIADCDNDTAELNEANNESTTQETVYWAGYSADEELNMVLNGTIRGGTIYTTGDGGYSMLYNPGDIATANYAITIPDGAAVELARFYVYYTWSKSGTTGVYPVMEVSIDGNVIPSAAEYNDRPCESPAIAFEYPWGNYAYNLTPYIQESGDYTVTVENVGPGYYSFCIAAPGMLVLYEDTTEPERDYFILEGADILEGGRRGGAGYLSLEECTNNAEIPGGMDVGKVNTATLGIVCPWGGAAWGTFTSYYWFNDNYLGNGSIMGGYSSLYQRAVGGMSMYVGASGNAQMGVNASDVTGYLAGNNNTVTIGDDGDSMMVANAFLLVERGAGKPQTPFLIYGEVNDTEGMPVNNPDMTVKNMNTGGTFTVETDVGSSFYQVVTGSKSIHAGDVLQFTCGGTLLEHEVASEDMNAGVLEQNITWTEYVPPPEFWESCEEIASGLSYIGDWAAPAVFSKDGTLYLISGNTTGMFNGFNWNGSGWQTDTGIVAGLGDVGGDTTPAVFNKDGTWYLIAGELDGEFNGYNWTGSTWQSDTAIVSGLSGIGTNSAPAVFDKDGTWYMIAGERYGNIRGYNWTGSAWQSDDSMTSGLENVSSYTHPMPTVFYQDEAWYLIFGEYYGEFYGFNRTGSSWQADDAIVSGLGDLDMRSTPAAFEKDGTWYLIAGNKFGAFYGYKHPAEAPEIVSYAPETPVNDAEGAVRTFNVTVSQMVNVSWLIDGTPVQFNDTVTEASYTNGSAVVGYWNVSAVATNENGTDMQTWWWNVTQAGICGDVNDDGVINMADVMTLWYDYANYPTPGAHEVNCCG